MGASGDHFLDDGLGAPGEHDEQAQNHGAGGPEDQHEADADRRADLAAFPQAWCGTWIGEAVGGGVPVGTRDTLTVTATSTTRPDVRNFAVITSTVVAPKLFGDVNRDGRVDCDDLALIRASFGSKTGSRSFNPDVDVDSNGAIDIRDLASVTRLLPESWIDFACNSSSEQAKAAADLIARSYAETYGLPVAVTRLANVYGGGDFNFSRLVPETVRALLAGVHSEQWERRRGVLESVLGKLPVGQWRFLGPHERF